jgi:hypothetical protein
VEVTSLNFHHVPYSHPKKKKKENLAQQRLNQSCFGWLDTSSLRPISSSLRA